MFDGELRFLHDIDLEYNFSRKGIGLRMSGAICHTNELCVAHQI